MNLMQDLEELGFAEQGCPADCVESVKMQGHPMPKAIMHGEARGQDVVDMTRGAAALEDQPACRHFIQFCALKAKVAIAYVTLVLSQ